MKVIIPLISVFAWILIWVMSYLNLSETLPMATGTGVVVFFLISTVPVFFFPWAAMRIRSRLRFFAAAVSGFILLVFAANLAGYLVHRDFYAFPAQLVMIYLVILIMRIDSLAIIHRKQTVYAVIFYCGLTLFVVWFVWIILMSYTIVIRTEPRWIESSGYNLVNGLIGLMFLGSIVGLREHSKRRLHVAGGLIYLDDREISSILSPGENGIILAFLKTAGNTLNCRQLYQELKGAVLDEPPLPEPDPDCTECFTANYKVSSCSVYRNFKNRIKDTKKYLELVQIGTIVPVSENPREIKETGWRLRFFDDIGFEG